MIQVASSPDAYDIQVASSPDAYDMWDPIYLEVLLLHKLDQQRICASLLITKFSLC